MINVLFFVQYKSMGSSSRGIQSGGRILDFGDLCDVSFMDQVLRGSCKLMYQVGRGQLQDLISMRLDEFEAIFYPNGWLGNIECMRHLLGFNDRPSVFRKEIADKYGPQKAKVQSTTVYEPGSVITGVDGIKYIYMGHVSCLDIYIDKENKASYSGHFYIPMRYDKEENIEEAYKSWTRSAIMNYRRAEKSFLKSKKKAVAGSVVKTDFNGLVGTQTLNMVLPKCCMYNYNRQLQVISSV